MRTLILMLTIPAGISCKNFQLHPFELGVTLPYSEKCRFRNVVTHVVHEEEPLMCTSIKKRSIILTPEAWRVIRTDINNNCAMNQCTEINGKVDAIFLAIDKGLQEVP